MAHQFNLLLFFLFQMLSNNIQQNHTSINPTGKPNIQLCDDLMYITQKCPKKEKKSIKQIPKNFTMFFFSFNLTMSW